MYAMIPSKDSRPALWPSFAFFLAVISVFPSRVPGETVREMESDAGRVRITVVPMSAPAGVNGSVATADSAADTASTAASASPFDSIGDFTSLTEMVRKGDALLQIDYYDKGAREELRFPLKYSELRRFLKKYPLRYREGTPEERTVRMIGDLAGSLRIQMKDPLVPGGKP